MTISSDNRPSTYNESDLIVYRASSLGSCIRSLVLSRKGYSPAPFPPPVLEAFSQGNVWEDALVSYLRQQRDPSRSLIGWSVYGQQREYNLPVGAGRVVRCHVDGIGRKFISDDDTRKRSAPVVLEFKALSHGNFTKLSKGVMSFPHYGWQISVEMLATTYPCLLMYVDKDNSDINDPSTYTIKTSLIKEPPFSRGDIIRRIRTIENAVQSDVLPDCEETDFFCPFWQFHEHKEEIPIAIDNNTRQHLVRYLSLDADIKVLTKEKDELRKTVLLPQLTLDGSYDIDEHYRLVRSTSSRRSVDTDALIAMAEAKGIDVADYISYNEVITYTPKRNG